MQPRDLNEYRLALAAADMRIDSLIEEGARMVEDLAAYKLENAQAHRQLLADRKIIERMERTSGVLAVGEPCAGDWGFTGSDIQRHRAWSCRCGATQPNQCRTETAEQHVR